MDWFSWLPSCRGVVREHHFWQICSPLSYPFQAVNKHPQNRVMDLGFIRALEGTRAQLSKSLARLGHHLPRPSSTPAPLMAANPHLCKWRPYNYASPAGKTQKLHRWLLKHEMNTQDFA